MEDSEEPSPVSEPPPDSNGDLPEHQLRRNYGRYFTADREDYQSWVDRKRDEIRAGLYSMKMDEPVIEFEEGTKEMTVTFNHQLVSLVEEAGDISSFGFTIPSDIREIIKVGTQLMAPAKKLMDIARFHNTVGETMVKVQRPMMLDEAVTLSKMVKHATVTWKDAAGVATFIDNLSNVVESLGRNNQILSDCHYRIISLVCELFKVDLIRKNSKWRDSIKEIIEIVRSLDKDGFKNTKGWQEFIDYQIYKVLDGKYQEALYKYMEVLPEVRVHVMIHNHGPMFKPGLEDMRIIYRNNITKLINVPATFEGTIFKSDFFAAITKSDVAVKIINIIMQHEDGLFSELAEKQDKYKDWILSDKTNVAALHIKGDPVSNDWEEQFRASKNRAQEIASLNFDDDRIGCFLISYDRLRMEIDMQTRDHWDVLSRALSNSVADDIQGIRKFIAEGTAILNKGLVSVDDITRSSVEKESISAKREKIELNMKDCEMKNQLLLTWVKTGFDLGEVKSMWKDFEELLGSHQNMIFRQIESIKSNLRTEADQLNTEIENFKLRWDQLKPKDIEILKNPDHMDKMIGRINEMNLAWHELLLRQGKVEETCTALSVPSYEFPSAESIQHDLATNDGIWGKLSAFRSRLKEFEDEDWVIFRARPYLFQEFLDEWESKFDNESKSEFIIAVLKDIQEHRSIMPNLKYIRGDAFTEKHWAEMFSLLRMPQKTVNSLTAGDLLAARTNIANNLKELKDLNSRATGEVTVRQALTELDAWEIDAKFQLAAHTDSHSQAIMLIQDFKTVVNKIGDNQSLLQSIRTSPYYSSFWDRILIWEKKLSDLEDHIKNLSTIQRRWIYLEPVFSHGVLESEQQRFRRINDEFRTVMQEVFKDSRVVSLGKQVGIGNRLTTLVDQLARCQTSLNEFLEKKRSGFPRFYFLGDDDLLEIMGQSTKPAVIQAHLKKLFAGIHNVDFDDGFTCITTMKSLEGESVTLKSPVKVSSKIEEWLNELSNQMRLTLKSMLVDSVSNAKQNTQNSSYLNKCPSQIVCLSNAVVFTEECEGAIRAGKLVAYLTSLKGTLDAYTRQCSHDPELSDGAEKVLQLKVKALILDVIHHIEVVEYLIAANVRHISDWHWHKQLRFYIRNDDTAIVKMADAEFTYSYEYQGNAPKLVHTPLTDKCYLTLTQGMRMGLGGNPYGPAGTGKTESVKALGGILGRQVLVFNCDEGIDVQAMGRIFTGLVKCGAWGCFDEFNRLDGLTLSSVSLQIQPIQMALKEGLTEVLLMDERVSLDPSCGIFVTLNPAGQGYGGRNNLPDNLKQLFRPVVMSSPDNERIAEVILYTEGFKHATALGKKLVEVFEVSQKLLTPQTHYDWGLRALKTVLKGCGSALAEHTTVNSSITQDEEANLVVAALRLNTLPKLTYADCLRFDSLVKDVFSNAIFKNLGNAELAEHVRIVYHDLNLEINENQVKKCLELYEQLQQRMGIVIVGPSCCGKSTVLTVLRHALLRMGRQVKTHVMNPKAMPRAHLLGHINLDTRQWTDGVLTMKAQQVYAELPEITSWIICDGDIDPEWVESLNSVLDDNRLLTLPSGWRIKFGPNVNFIFETHDLSLASPATISRMGMIFMSEEDADVKNIVNAWLSKQPNENQAVLRTLLDDHLFKALSIVKKYQDPVIAVPQISSVKTVLSLMSQVTTSSQLVQALIRGLGGHLLATQLTTFANEILKEFNLPEIRNPLNVYCNPRTMRIEPYVEEPLSFEDGFEPNNFPLVKTADVQRVLDHIQPWLTSQESFLLIGPEGCGKSMVLNYAFRQLRSTEVAIIHCSGLISPENVLQKLSQTCITMSTNTGRVYKSKDGERLILYFKDINLVKPDKWGTCQLVEFLRQIIVFGGFFDKNLEWVRCQGIQVVGSLAVGESSGRYFISPRFTSRVHICGMSDPHADQLFTFSQSYLTLLTRTYWPTNPFTQDTKEIEAVAHGMVRVYTEVRKTFTPVKQGHYLFSPRDLTKWILGLMRYGVAGVADKPDKNEVYFAWCSEACRIFRDKLVSDEDKGMFTDTILLPVAGQWGITCLDETKLDAWWISCYATNILHPTTKITPSPLLGDELVKIQGSELETLVQKGSLTFSRENRNLNVVCTRELMESVVRFDRILTFPTSNLLLVGRAGVGRRSALSIVSVLHHAVLMTLKVGRYYPIKSFKTDLKAAVQTSAIEGNQVYLVVEDFQVIDVVFLDMLNSLVSSGEIPGLYSPEELENVVSSLRDVASAEGFTSNLYSYFAQRVQNNLRVIFIMDYTNDTFIKNCKSNPALYKLCHTVWLDGWSEKTMKELPLKIVTNMYNNSPELKLDCLYGFKTPFPDNEAKARFFNGFKNIHNTIDPSMAYPRRYATLIFNYALLYRTRRKELADNLDKLKAGIFKLEESTGVVQVLKAEASQQETILAEKQEEANKAMDMISLTLKNSNVQKGELEDLRKKTENEKEILAQKKSAIDAELAEIEPMVKMAQAAVGNIKNEALTEIRSLRAPPDVIRDILEGVLRLMGTRDMSWNSMKSFLSKRGVKDEIRNFDSRNIIPSDREAVEKMLKLKQTSFDPKNAKRASTAAAPLAEWVVANVKFSKVLEKIEPLERYKRTLEQNLELTESEMNEISSGLTTVDEKVKALTERYKQCSSEAMGIQFNLDKAKSTLAAAEGLVGKLNDEYTRWKKELHELDADVKSLPFHALMASSFITYLSNASEDARIQLISTWANILQLENYDFCKFLVKEGFFLHWQSFGLPSDRLSRENAIIIIQTCLRPYIVDPSNRATEWLISQMSASSLTPVVISLHDPKFTSELELAIRFGKTFIVTEVDSIEPLLIPILRGDLASNGARDVLPVGDKLIDYNPNFRLFLATRNPTPVIPPDAASVITVVNFTTTRAGLTSQLLTITLSSEHPDLKSKNSELVSTIENLKLQVEEVSNKLLRELASAKGNLLENKELLGSLNETKASALEVTEKLREASKIESLMAVEIDVYRPFAEFGSRLYFAIVGISQLNPMYQFSLNSFVNLFGRTLNEKNLSNNNVQHRISALKTSLFEIAYEFVCQALYKTNRLTFALHLANIMFPNKFESMEWEAFTGQLLLNPTDDDALNTTIPSWIPQDRKFSIQIFMSTFPALYEKLQLHRGDLWSGFYKSNDCEDAIPEEIKNVISPFQEVLLINILRPDRLLTAVYNFTRETFGRKTLYPTPPGLLDVIAGSTSEVPILLLISSGSDPSQEIREVASATVGLKKYVEIPLGQGSIEDAFSKLRTAAQVGHWVCIKNLHLVTHLLDSLEKEIRVLKSNEVFRLWLTSEPHLGFPKVLAQSCMKFAYESPEGVKKNIQRTYKNWSQDYFTGNRNTMRCQTLFTLATFHAIVQERRTYIPQGWNTFFEFNDSDIRAGCDIIEQIYKGGVERSKNIQWSYIHGIFQNAIYGSRIDNDYDSRVLSIYLKEYFNGGKISGDNYTGTFGPNITLPSSTNMDDYLRVVESIPENDRPSFFGLPSNIEKSWQKSTSSNTINQLKMLSRGFADVLTFDRPVWSKELSPILLLWKKLAQIYLQRYIVLQTSHIQPTLCHKLVSPPVVRSEKNLAASPVDAFVLLEHYNIFVLIQRVHLDLGVLSRVIRGINLPTSAAFLTAQALIVHEVPLSWRTLWDGPSNPSQYLTSLIERGTTVHEVWIPRAKEGKLLDHGIKLSDLINPDTFFTAFKQYCARRREVAMDELELFCTWDNNSEDLKSDKFYCPLQGIQLEGCIFKRGRLQESQPEDPPASEAPMCYVTWISRESKEKKKHDGVLRHTTLSVPLYANESRKKLICSLDVPVSGVEGDEAKWIKAGVAMFLR